MEQQPLNDIRPLLQQKIFGNPCDENFNPCSRALFNWLRVGKPITSFKNCLVLAYGKYCLACRYPTSDSTFGPYCTRFATCFGKSLMVVWPQLHCFLYTCCAVHFKTMAGISINCPGAYQLFSVVTKIAATIAALLRDVFD